MDFESILITWKMMGMKAMLANLIEWQPLNFRDRPAYLIYLMAFIVLLAASGMRLCVSRLAILCVVVWVGFSYTRGFVVFILVVPFLIARPLARHVPYTRVQDPIGTKDPVLAWLQRAGRSVVGVSLAIVLVATFVSARLHELGPPGSTAPRAAIEYVKKSNISIGRVLNHYDFGGYLIFSGIPTFVDSRAELFTDEFFQAYFSALDLKDIGESYRLLDRYSIDWILLRPGEPFANALKSSPEWRRYSDRYAVVFIRA